MRNVSVLGPVLVSLVVLPLLFSACATTPRARMTGWKNNELTACCGSPKYCNEKDWERAVVPFCAGSLKLVGGQMQENVTGYQAMVKDKEKEKFQLQPQVVEQSCRTFQCEGTVIPPR